MHLVPNSHGTVREFNPCHEPEGSPAGGEFAHSHTGHCQPGHKGQSIEQRTQALERIYRTTGKTPEERTFAAQIAKAEILTEAQMEALGPHGTTSKYTDKNGTWTPARQALHDKILAQVVRADILSQEKPVAIILAGMTASLKTTTSKDLSKSDKVYLNSDDFKEYLPEYEGFNASVVHDESGYLVDKAFEMATANRQSLILDSTIKTLGGTDYETAKADGAVAAKVQRLLDMGYRVEVRFNHNDIELSVQNSLRRYMEQVQKGEKHPRFVSPSIIRQNYNPEYGTEPRRTFEKIKHMLSAYAIYDVRDALRDRTRKTKPRLLASKGTLTP